MSLSAQSDSRTIISPQVSSSTKTAINVLPKLLMLSAAGLFFGDIAIFSVGGFIVTPYHLLFPLTAALAVSPSKQPQDSQVALFGFWLFMALTELAHVTWAGYITEPEWLRSFAQFLVYSLSFLVITRKKLRRTELVSLGPWVAKLSIVLSATGIFQYILFIFQIPAYLPDEFRARSGFDPLFSTRYGGFSPAIGFATEPSHYTLALCVLLACLLFFVQIGILKGRLQRISIAMVMAGVLVSYSISGVIISIALLIFSLIIPGRKRIFLVSVIGFFLWLLLTLNFTQPIVERFSIVAEGQDASSMMRVVASIRLLFANSSRLETMLFGTGMGLEAREYETYVQVYTQAIPRYLALREIKVHNIFAVIKFLQGWVGLLIYGIMIWLSLRPAIRAWRLYIPLFVFFFAYQFSTGLYLTPAFWSTYALMTVLWRSDLTPKMDDGVASR